MRGTNLLNIRVHKSARGCSSAVCRRLPRKRVLVTMQSRRTNQQYERIQNPSRKLAQNNEIFLTIFEILENLKFGASLEQSLEQVWCDPNLLQTLQQSLEQVWSPNLFQTLLKTRSECINFMNFMNSRPPVPPRPDQGPGVFEIQEIF